ncbi:MAG: hypothetical protein ACD_45C00230G0003 [uncultured bacterium]|nr:MAG: hypothetical protein ACD_45C00230G0003 [uncultured bacterium]
METISTPSQIENEQFWQNHNKLQKASDLSRAAYCRQHGLNYYRFCYWAKRSRQNCSVNKLVSVKLKPMTNQGIQNILCTFELGNGRCLKIHDTQALSFILERIR